VLSHLWQGQEGGLGCRLGVPAPQAGAAGRGVNSLLPKENQAQGRRALLGRGSAKTGWAGFRSQPSQFCWIPGTAFFTQAVIPGGHRSHRPCSVADSKLGRPFLLCAALENALSSPQLVEKLGAPALCLLCLFPVHRAGGLSMPVPTQEWSRPHWPSAGSTAAVRTVCWQGTPTVPGACPRLLA
jgi:hypothetical protein